MNKELNENELKNVNGGAANEELPRVRGPIASGGIHVWAKP